MPAVEEFRIEEIKELKMVIEALARTPRLAKLLRYMGDKYFSGTVEDLTEYNIATEICGRSPASFVAGEDAIARVEVHRLRKKLRDFYENGGRNHTVHIAIPAGTYVPSFTHHDSANGSGMRDSAEAAPETGHPVVSEAESAESSAARGPISAWVLHAFSSRFSLLIAIAVVLGIAAIVGLRLSRKNPKMAQGKAPLTGPVIAGTLTADRGAIRILAGYDGNPIRDPSGDLWTKDRFFDGGGTWPRPAGFLAKTSDPLLFQFWRSGDFKYDIPLHPGVYELHLFFLSNVHSENSAPSTFVVSANGQPLLQGFDINADALGDEIADERIFKDVSPASDGFLHLRFDHGTGVPSLSALEIVPGIPHRQLPIRLVMQRTSFVDHDGNSWGPDDYYLNGALSTVHQAITGTRDPDLFGSERYGHFTYTIPVDPHDEYTLALHFTEVYFGPQAPGGGGTGSRIFRVFCNGKTILDNFDIFREAGSFHLLTKTFQHVKPSPQGKLDLTFEPVINNATVSAIEVLDESR